MTSPATTGGRTAQKRDAILTAGTAVFLRTGFRGTTMDEIAAHAHVSKQTVYKQFRDKEQLFREIVGGMVDRSNAIMEVLAAAHGSGDPATQTDLEERLIRLARALLDGVLRPEVLSLRRLLITEAEQFPELASAYYERGPARGVSTIRQLLEPSFRAGLLRGDLDVAATQFAYLAVAATQDRAMFAPDQVASPDERQSRAVGAARTFLAAFGAEPDPARREHSTAP